MLRKLIMFAITSGLAKKAWDQYRARKSTTPTSGRGSYASGEVLRPTSSSANQSSSQSQYH